MLTSPLRSSAFRTFLLDQDGVLFTGEKPIPGALEAVRRLQAGGAACYFITNNSGKSRAAVAARLEQQGVACSAADVVTAGSATGAYLNAQRLRSAYVIGEAGLREELAEAGCACWPPTTDSLLSNEEFAELFSADAPVPDAVVVGLCSSFTYRHLATASAYVQRGARLVGTNPDAADRVGPGLAPGAGALIAAVEVASGCKASVIVGKPNPDILTSLLSSRGLDASRALFVGDRLDTDMLCGRNAGVRTLLVLTGVNSREEAEALDSRDPRAPDYILPSLADLQP